jgi:membrane peptidoglycan carboxypeptidase
MDTLQQVPVTMAAFSCTLAAGTTTTISTTGSTHYSIKGKSYIKTAITNGATPTTDATTGAAFVGITANQGTVVVIGFDSSGAVKASQGAVQALDSAGNFVVAPQFPGVPDSVCPVGYIVLKGGSTLSGTFTFGSSNLSGVTGMTYTFVSVFTLPARPQVA